MSEYKLYIRFDTNGINLNNLLDFGELPVYNNNDITFENIMSLVKQKKDCVVDYAKRVTCRESLVNAMINYSRKFWELRHLGIRMNFIIQIKNSADIPQDRFLLYCEKLFPLLNADINAYKNLRMKFVVQDGNPLIYTFPEGIMSSDASNFYDISLLLYTFRDEYFMDKMLVTFKHAGSRYGFFRELSHIIPEFLSGDEYNPEILLSLYCYCRYVAYDYTDEFDGPATASLSTRFTVFNDYVTDIFSQYHRNIRDRCFEHLHTNNELACRAMYNQVKDS